VSRPVRLGAARGAPLTSDDAEELLDAHADVDPAEELVHVAAPLLQHRAARVHAGRTEAAGRTGRSYRTGLVRLAGKDFAQPAQHQLQPLHTHTHTQLMEADSSCGVH